MPFDDREFDVVLGMGVLEYTNAPAALADMARVSKPGALVLVTMLNPVSPYQDEGAGLAQDPLRNLNLARVGQDRSLLQQTNVVFPQTHFRRKDTGQLSDTSDVVRPHTVFQLQRAAQRPDHRVVLVARVDQVNFGALALGLETPYRNVERHRTNQANCSQRRQEANERCKQG